MNTPFATFVAPVTEEAIRNYARQLYLQSGNVPGRDLANWLEAKACLEAGVPISDETGRQPPPQKKPRGAANKRPLAA